jgi:hypothetical protein
VLGRGGHGTLLAVGGVYAGMWRQQKQAAERDPSYA